VRELYLYWRARPGVGREAVTAAAAFQQRWRERVPDLDARLLQRAEGERATRMEIYTRPGGIDAELQRALVEEGNLALAPWLDGARHLEVFEPIAS
jgi:Domain of unknown function (DUF4936)